MTDRERLEELRERERYEQLKARAKANNQQILFGRSGFGASGPTGFGVPGALPSREQMQAATDSAKQFGRELINFATEFDPDVDYSGLKDPGKRAALSRRDTREEVEKYLNDTFGQGNWTTDKFNRLAIKRPGQKPLVIDNPYWLSYGGLGPGELAGDIADMAGDAPEIIAAIAATATGPQGAAGGLPMLLGGARGALGAMGGKLIGESLEEAAGENLQSLEEVAGDIGEAGLYGLLGELSTRTAAATGRKLMAPYNTDAFGNPGKGALTESRLALAEEAKELGAVPKISRVVDAPMASRFEGMFDLLFGDPDAAKNARALLAERDRLINAQSPERAGFVEVGDDIRAAFASERKRIYDEQTDKFSAARALIGDGAVVPTAKLREAAKDLLGRNPTEVKKVPGAVVDSRGQPLTYTEEAGRVLASPRDRISFLQDIIALPDQLPIRQWQTLMTDIRKRNKSIDITQSLDDTYANALRSAGANGLDDGIKRAKALGNTDLEQGLRDYQSTRNNYRARVDKFDTKLVSEITKKPELAGSLYPEEITELVFTKGITPVKEMMSVLPEQTKQKVRRLTMEKILSRMGTITDDPSVPVFDPKGIGKAIQQMSEGGNEGKLSAIFGKEALNELNRLERVTRFLTTKKGMSGQLVAAGLALHPLQNLTKLARLRAYAYILSSKAGRNYLTTGISAPNTRAGAFALNRVMQMAMWLGNQEASQQMMREE